MVSKYGALMNTQTNSHEKEEVREKRINDLKSGIAAYGHERDVLLRLLRKRGSFTSKQFDLWFRTGREKHQGKRMRRYGSRFQFYASNAFVLGDGRNGGTYWARMLNLLQIMIDIGEVDVGRNDKGIIVYTLPDQVH